MYRHVFDMRVNVISRANHIYDTSYQNYAREHVALSRSFKYMFLKIGCPYMTFNHCVFEDELPSVSSEETVAYTRHMSLPFNYVLTCALAGLSGK
jgi:hypothetical protein